MSANPSRAVFKIVLVLIVLAAAGAALAFLGRPVAKVATVTRGRVANVVPGSVVVDPERVSQITSEVEGRLIQSELHAGRAVKEGEIVAQLDTADVDLEIAHAKSEFAAAKRNSEIAQKVSDLGWETTKEDLATAERQFKMNGISEAELERKKREFKAAEQKRAREKVDDDRNLENLDNLLKTAERKKEKMAIRAPFDGTLTEVLVNKNDLVAGKQALANIISQARIVRAKISEENFAAIQIGDKAKVSFLGYHGQAFDAKVTRKLPTADADTQRYTVFLDVNIPPEKLLPNLTGEVGIILAERANVIVAPRRAMWDRNVYVVVGGRVQLRPILYGFIDFNVFEVQHGLEPGDLVIVEELEKFHEGQRVRTAPAR